MKKKSTSESVGVGGGGGAALAIPRPTPARTRTPLARHLSLCAFPPVDHANTLYTSVIVSPTPHPPFLSLFCTRSFNAHASPTPDWGDEDIADQDAMLWQDDWDDDDIDDDFCNQLRAQLAKSAKK